MQWTRRTLLAALGGAAAVALVGCKAKPPPVAVALGAATLPNWLAVVDPEVQGLYAWAAEHKRELAYIPCYCGCVGSGHLNNYDCYFKGGVYEQHAVG